MLELEVTNEIAHVQLDMLHLAWGTADPLPHLDAPYACLRASAAMSDALPADVVARLLDDEDSRVRTNMAWHARERIDPVTAERIDRDYRPVKYTSWRPADELPLPSDVLRRLASDADARMRLLAPRDIDLPADLVGRPAADADPDVRRVVASYPRLSARDLVALPADPVDRVAAEAVGDGNLAREDMDRVLALAGL